MNIYRISQNVNTDWDTYDSAIVVARNEKEAQQMSPIDYDDEVFFNFDPGGGIWAYKLEDIKVELIGKADKKFKEPTLVLSSFNAG